MNSGAGSRSGFRSGFVAIVGRPNTGKSTLINTLAKRKIAIVSDKPQTTRHRIQGVVTLPDAQIVFIDTPGFHKPKDPFGIRLNQIVRSAMKEVDAIVFLLDGSDGIGRGDEFIAGELRAVSTPVVVAVNKTDLVDEGDVEAQIERAAGLLESKAVMPISALRGTGVEALLDRCEGLLPEGPQYYPSGVITDQPEAVLIAELIREKALMHTREEVPHSVAVEVEDIRPREGKELIDVSAWIFVERESQKGIIIGRGGRMLKTIGEEARRDIEPLLGSQIFLELRVKVSKDWRRDEDRLRRLGYAP